MKYVKDAVVQRFKEICLIQNITYNDLAVRAGVTPSTVYSLMDERRRDVSIITIKKLCDGLNITVKHNLPGSQKSADCPYQTFYQ